MSWDSFYTREDNALFSMQIMQWLARGSGSSWLSVMHESGVVAPLTQSHVLVKANATKLPPGLYFENMTVASNDPNQPAIIIPVNLTVLSAPHDLVITNLTIEGNVEVGRKQWINGTVLNNGTSNETNIEIRLLVNFGPENSSIISSLESGEQDTVSFEWVPLSDIQYNLTLYAVPVTGETFTSNNWWNTTVSATFPPDTEPPFSDVMNISDYWHTTSALALTAGARDNGSLVIGVELWFRFSTDNITWEPWKLFDNDAYGPTWSWTFVFPGGDGYYEFYSIAYDSENNREMTPLSADTACGLDRYAPVPAAGPDKTLYLEGVVNFDGSNSTDNIGIVNYTWDFNDGIGDITLFGDIVSHLFSEIGEYSVRLTVRDAAGNNMTDMLWVTIEGPESQDPENLDDGGISIWSIFLLILLCVAAALILFIYIFKSKERSAMTETCPTCGYELEKGTDCPFCATESEPPQPEPAEGSAPPHQPLSNEELIARTEKAFKEGKITENQYLTNLEKFNNR
jgi:hypothetical protein